MTYSVYSVTHPCSSADDMILGAKLCDLRRDMIVGKFTKAVLVHSESIDLGTLVRAISCSHSPLLIDAPRPNGGRLTLAFFAQEADVLQTTEGLLYVPGTVSTQVYSIHI